ncbi:MAG: hypothetical protein IT430_12155 [Phycisphaerales bacterium]|nr:hypothetical protein [Phycisphaerales bacterium]
MPNAPKPGSQITLSITKAPTRPDDIDTLRRLMRMDRRIQSVLDDARLARERTTKVHQRGGRDWAVRQSPPKFVHPQVGATWQLQYRPQIAPDLASVAEFISIQS